MLADAFTKSAREKIEAAGGTAQVIEIPTAPLAALGVEPAEAQAAGRREGADEGTEGRDAEPPRPDAATEATASRCDAAPADEREGGRRTA